MSAHARALASVAAGLALAAFVAFVASAPRAARAQPAPGSTLSREDSVAVSAAMAASDSALTAGTRRRLHGDPDRLELGIALPKGYFDYLGTFGYRRYVHTDARFQHWLLAELAGGHKNYFSEGAASIYWLIQLAHMPYQEGAVRPVLEGGVGAHLVAQFADIQGFDDFASHAEGLIKLHGIAGVEADLHGRWGVSLRGRLSIPSHRPLDYLQLALFRR